MASVYGIKAKFEPVRVSLYSDIESGYSEKVGGPLENGARVIYILSTVNAPLMFSTDGFNDHFAIAASGYIVLDVTTNHLINEEGWFFPVGTQFYVRNLGSPTSGDVYLSVIYGSN